MLPMLKDKFTDIFVPVDDFCKESGDLIASLRLPGGEKKSRNRKTGLCDSEVIAILLMFHHGHFTNFKHYYLHFVAANCGDLFPGLLSYNRFVELQRRVAIPLMLFLKTRCMGRSRGTLPVQLAGNIKHGGLFETAFGLTLGELVNEIGGGTASGRPVRAVQVASLVRSIAMICR
mgnify:CR=1 FL=1